MGGGLAVDGRVDGQDDFADPAGGDARDERLDGEIVGPTPSSGDSTPPST